MAKNTGYTMREEYMKFSSNNYGIHSLLTYCQYDANLILPYENILDKYQDYFKQYLQEVEVDSKYFKRPTSFANYYYGDPSLYWLVLYFANIPSIIDFTKRKIKVLPIDRLNDINQIIILNRDKIEQNYKEPIIIK